MGENKCSSEEAARKYKTSKMCNLLQHFCSLFRNTEHFIFRDTRKTAKWSQVHAAASWA